MTGAKKYFVRVRLWIDEQDGPFLGVGRVVLLERIKETGSITRAARSIGMSYRQAWQLVSDMNRRSGKPLVEKRLGGRNGGGAVVTESGERAISMFHELACRVNRFVQKEARTMKL